MRGSVPHPGYTVERLNEEQERVAPIMSRKMKQRLHPEEVLEVAFRASSNTRHSAIV